VLREIALGSAEAVLAMHYCAVYDVALQPSSGGRQGETDMGFRGLT
jgi:hypothetical protein